MRLRQLMIGWTTVCLAPLAIWGSTIHDPHMGIDEGSFSDAISLSTTFSPNANAGGAFAFFNATGDIIIGLTFDTFILKNLTPPQLAGVFSCNDASTPETPNPFFLNC